MAGYNLSRFSDDILAKNSKSQPSFSVHLYAEHWTINHGGKFLYTQPVASLLDDIRAYRIPIDFLEIFEVWNVNFFEGCLIVELLDYRPPNPKDKQLEEPQRTRVVLHPNSDTLYADIRLLKQKSGRNWTDAEALDIESRLLLATAPPLCLDPDPHLMRMANNILRVSTPTTPVSLKRKAIALDPEEDETDKARRSKMMQYLNPRLNRATHGAPLNYRILDAIKKAREIGAQVPAPITPQPPTQYPQLPTTNGQPFSNQFIHPTASAVDDTKTKLVKIDQNTINHGPAQNQFLHQQMVNQHSSPPPSRSPIPPSVFRPAQNQDALQRNASPPNPHQQQHPQQQHPMQHQQIFMPSSNGGPIHMPPQRPPSSQQQPVALPTFQPPGPGFLKPPPLGKAQPPMKAIPPPPTHMQNKQQTNQAAMEQALAAYQNAASGQALQQQQQPSYTPQMHMQMQAAHAAAAQMQAQLAQRTQGQSPFPGQPQNGRITPQMRAASAQGQNQPMRPNGMVNANANTPPHNQNIVQGQNMNMNRSPIPNNGPTAAQMLHLSAHPFPGGGLVNNGNINPNPRYNVNSNAHLRQMQAPPHPQGLSPYMANGPPGADLGLIQLPPQLQQNQYPPQVNYNQVGMNQNNIGATAAFNHGQMGQTIPFAWQDGIGVGRPGMPQQMTAMQMQQMQQHLQSNPAAMAHMMRSVKQQDR